MTRTARRTLIPAQIIARYGPNGRLDGLGHRLQAQTAQLVTLALAVISAELDDRAPYVGAADTTRPNVSGSGRTVWVEEDEHGPAEHVPVTSVEAAVMRGATVRDYREELRDRIDGIVMAVTSLDNLCRHIAGDLAHEMPQLCDGRARGYDGHVLPWAPGEKGTDRGWHDPTCRDIAGPTGLCARCLVRMNRWRSARGLEPVGVKAAA